MIKKPNSKDQDKLPARSDDGWPTAEFLDIPENIQDIKKLNELLDNSHKIEKFYLKALYSLLAVWAFTFILLLLK